MHSRPALSQPGLLFMDMDSTLIQCECLDEIAVFLDLKPQVAAITERAMRGEMDFAASLFERVRLLAGLDAKILDRVYDKRIELTDGAERLITTLKQYGWKVGLVSGGFTYFTDKLKDRLNLDFILSNVLDIRDNKLTGNIIGDIVDAQAKKNALLSQAAEWHIPVEQTVAVGDGANDLPMILAAGLGIAFHAKPMVAMQVACAINKGGLDGVLEYLQ